MVALTCGEKDEQRLKMYLTHSSKQVRQRWSMLKEHTSCCVLSEWTATLLLAGKPGERGEEADAGWQQLTPCQRFTTKYAAAQHCRLHPSGAR